MTTEPNRRQFLRYGAAALAAALVVSAGLVSVVAAAPPRQYPPGIRTYKGYPMVPPRKIPKYKPAPAELKVRERIEEYARAVKKAGWMLVKDARFPARPWAGTCAHTMKDKNGRIATYIVQAGGYGPLLKESRTHRAHRRATKRVVAFNLNTREMIELPKYELARGDDLGLAAQAMLSTERGIFSAGGGYTDVETEQIYDTSLYLLRDGSDRWMRAGSLFTAIKETDMVEINGKLYVMPGRQGGKDRQLIVVCDKNGRNMGGGKCIGTEAMSSPSGTEALGSSIYWFPGRFRKVRRTAADKKTFRGYGVEILKIDVSKPKPRFTPAGTMDRHLRCFTIEVDEDSGVFFRIGGRFLPYSDGGLYPTAFGKLRRPRFHDYYTRELKLWSPRDPHSWHYAGDLPIKGRQASAAIRKTGSSVSAENQLLCPFLGIIKRKDGKYLYCLDNDTGTLYRLKLPGPKEMAEHAAKVAAEAAKPENQPSPKEAQDLLARAEDFVAKGLKKRAAVIYRIIVKQYPKSGAGVRAAKRLKELE